MCIHPFYLFQTIYIIYGILVNNNSFLVIMIPFLLFKYFFNVDPFKVFIEFVTTLLLFYGLDFSLQGVWDLGSLTRD